MTSPLMRLIFDLDDTLYDEISYVHSGFGAVATSLEQRYGIPAFESAALMKRVLSEEGRGKVFDLVLESYGLKTKTEVQRCLATYRTHFPVIDLFPDAARILNKYRAYPKYLVTDGNKGVQAKKILALNISSYFTKIFITHRYGVKHAKPSVYCFDKIRKLENCDFSDMVYVGDNPAKDFVGIKKVGIRTVRVLTGNYRDIKVPLSYEAEFVIPSIGNFDIKALQEN